MARRRMDRSFLAGPPMGKPAASDSVVVLSERRNEFGVIPSFSPDGELQRILIRMPRRERSARGGADIAVGPNWLAAGNLAIPFAEAIFEHVRHLGPSVQHSKIGSINRFFAFLAERGQSAKTLADLDTSLFNDFITWLNGQNLKDITKAGHLCAARDVIRRLRRAAAYAELLPKDVRIKGNPWPGRAQNGNPRTGMSITDLVRIERAYIREMQEAMQKIDEGDRLVAAGRNLLANGISPVARRVDVLLAVIVDEYGGYVSDKKFFFAQADGRRRQIEAFGGLSGIAPWLYATGRSLAPFVIMLAIRTAFNPEAVLSLTRSAIRRSALLDDGVELEGRDKRYRVVGRKGRSGRDQVRTFPADCDDIDSPVRILENVDRITRRLRLVADARKTNLAFIYQGRDYGEVCTFIDATSSFPYVLKQFIADNGLPSFTLASIRPTISDLVDQLSGGDIKAQQAVLNHWNVETTDDHYVSGASRNRRIERLAEIQNGRERFVATDGRADPRNGSPGNTRRAATAGFECTDPYDSPRPGQLKGRLCTAWGDCAVCPRVAVNPRDPHALACLVRLDHALDAARERLHPARWLQWAGVQTALREWIKKFSDPSVWAAAQTIPAQPLMAIE